MRSWLRRVRGAIGMGLAWAAGWAPIGAILGLFNFAAGAAAFGSGPAWLAFATAVVAGAGFVCGISFSAVLGITEGRRRFDEMSLPRFAGWGAMGGVVVGGLLVAISVGLGGTPDPLDLFLNVGLVGLLGAGSSAGSLALARLRVDGELLEAGEDLVDAGLTKKEKRELLGS